MVVHRFSWGRLEQAPDREAKSLAPSKPASETLGIKNGNNLLVVIPVAVGHSSLSFEVIENSAATFIPFVGSSNDEDQFSGGLDCRLGKASLVQLMPDLRGPSPKELPSLEI